MYNKTSGIFPAFYHTLYYNNTVDLGGPATLNEIKLIS